MIFYESFVNIFKHLKCALKAKYINWKACMQYYYLKKKMKKKNLRQNETIIADIRKKADIEKLFGIWPFKKSIDETVREAKKGYED